MFTRFVPNRYWGEVVLTTAYLINRLPFKVLKYQTALHNLTSIFPYVRILNNLPPKVFRCEVYVYQTSPNRHKHEPRALKCIFIGYPPTQKGYKCFCPISQKVLISCDVTFCGEWVILLKYHTSNEGQPLGSHYSYAHFIPSSSTHS